jgi:hypothetical protein
MSKEQIKKAAFEVVDELFYKGKAESTRDTIGVCEQTEFTFDEKKYLIKWDGFWESADHYDYSITGEDVFISGIRLPKGAVNESLSKL